MCIRDRNITEASKTIFNKLKAAAVGEDGGIVFHEFSLDATTSI